MSKLLKEFNKIVKNRIENLLRNFVKNAGGGGELEIRW